MTHASATPRQAIGVYFSRRVLPLLALGFASGLPFALTNGTLQAWATVEKVSLQDIGFFTLAGVAYTLKFLWSPLLDRYAPPLLGRQRGWMLLMQWLLGLSIMGMGLLSPGSALLPVAAMAVLVTVLSATQDIAFGGYCADMLRPEERGAGAALNVLGYRVAMVVSGGLALVLADSWLGWGRTYVLMGALMLVCSAATFWAPEPEAPQAAPHTLGEAVVEPFLEFFSRPGAVGLLLLIVFYKLGDAFAGALSSTFLIRAAGYTATEVGSVNKVLGMTATIVGALAGGSIMARWGLYRSLMAFGLLQAVSNLGYWLISVSPTHLWLMAGGIGIENLCGGLGTAAFVGLLMALCRQEFLTTQFALLSALSAVGRTLAGPVTPVLVEYLDWPGFFLATVLIAVPGLILLRMYRQQIDACDGPLDGSQSEKS